MYDDVPEFGGKKGPSPTIHEMKKGISQNEKHKQYHFEDL